MQIHRHVSGPVNGVYVTREVHHLTATVGVGSSVSNAVHYGDFAGGVVITPDALDATSAVAFLVSYDDDASFFKLCDKTNALISLVVSTNERRAYAIPDELFGVRWFKLWTQAAGINVVQAASRDFVIMLKG